MVLIINAIGAILTGMSAYRYYLAHDSNKMWSFLILCILNIVCFILNCLSRKYDWW